MSKWKTNLEIFIGGFLPFLCHGSWWWSSKSVNAKEQYTRNDNTECCVNRNLGPFTRWWFSSWSVWSKRYPPSWILVSFHFDAGYQGTIARTWTISSIHVILPAFFSCSVISFQSIFIRSLNCIQSSACSWGGICSHLFSIPARVGLEIACAARVVCLDWLVTGVWWLAENVGANCLADDWYDRDENWRALVHDRAAVDEVTIRGFKEWNMLTISRDGRFTSYIVDNDRDASAKRRLRPCLWSLVLI